VIRGDLRYQALSRKWNHCHVRDIADDVFQESHIVHCNQPDLAPCQMSPKRSDMMRKAAGLVGGETVAPKATLPTGPRPRVLMLTVVSGCAFDCLYHVTRPYHEHYAATHGYEYRVMTSPRRVDWPSPSWWKLEAAEIMEEENFDAVFCLDCDAWPWYGAPDIVATVPRGKFAAFDSFCLPGYSRNAAMASYADWCRNTGVEDVPHKPFYCNGGVWVCYRDAAPVLQCDRPIESTRYYEQHQINHNLYAQPDLFHPLPRKWNYAAAWSMAGVEQSAQRDVYIPHLNGVPQANRMPKLRRMIDKRNRLIKAGVIAL